MKNITILIFTFLLLLTSCSPKISSSIRKEYETLNYEEKVSVLQTNDKQPEDAEILGIVKVGDTGFSTKCDYDVVLEKAKLEARKVGGNAIRITKHKKPNFWSTCHRIEALILKLPS
jgi:lipoate-protein ligase A